MRRVFYDLNEMSFELPANWIVSDDVYSLPNGQGMINKENYLSDKGQVISLFEVHRNPDEFFEYYNNLLTNIKALTQKYDLLLHCNLKVGEYILPTYVIKGFDGEEFYSLQAFLNCGDCMACFIIKLPEFDGNIRKTIKYDIMQDLISLLRSVE